MADAPRRIVIGTAGHVDHGKTSLVRALTGTDCDRLPEEQRRGVSIELGFAEWRVSPELVASVIDVPGHERFVRTMIAGAQGIDVVMLVVAADDGVMPQTLEHLDVCELLGVTAGVIAITKCDAVDDARAAEVEAEVRNVVHGSFLEDAAIVRCSSRDARGLDALAAAVGRVRLERAAVEKAPAWMPVDRVFSLPGAGPVVTGTLVRGTLRVGDEVEALVAGAGAAPHQVRSLQVHGADVTEVVAPVRVAVALRGDARALPRRGAVLASPGFQRPTRAVILDVRVLGELKPRGEIMLHLGATQVAAVIKHVERVDTGRAYVLVQAREPFAAAPGLAAILRRPDLSAGRTVAGGLIVDPHPHGRRSIDVARAASVSDRLVLLAEEGASLDEMSRRLPASIDLPAELDALERQGRLVRDGKLVFLPAQVEAARAAQLDALERFHAERPERAGASAAEIAGVGGPAASVALDSLVREGKVCRDAATVRLSTHVPGGSSLGEQIARTYASSGLTPPREEEVLRKVGADTRAFRDAVDELKKAGRLRSIGGLLFEASAVEDLKRRVREHFASHGQLSPVELKELCGGVTRKYAIPLLEWLDREGVTRRVGDLRVPGPKARV
jgi:selenocysteine-specific elongation factor